MNKFLKYFLIFLSLLLVVVPVIFAVILLKSSQGAFEHSYNDQDSARQSNIRESKVDPSKDPISILFLGIDDNSGREKNGQSTEQSRSRCNDFLYTQHRERTNKNVKYPT